MSQSQGAATWLGDEYGDLNAKLSQAEKDLVDFKKKNNVVTFNMEDQQNELASRRRKISDELNAVEVKMIGIKAERDEFARLKSDDPLDDVTPGIADNAVMTKLKELYLEQAHKLVDLKGKYLDKHPLVVAQEARVGAARQDMVREAALASKTVEAQFAVLAKQQHDLKAALDGTTREANQLEDRAGKFRELKRNYDNLAKLSDQVGGRESETALAQHLKTNNVEPLDPALVPTGAIAPNVPRAVAVSVVVALILAIGLAFLLEMLDSTVKDQDHIERRIGLPFLGLIPSIDPARERASSTPPPPALADVIRRGSKDLHVLAFPKSAVAEYERLRTQVFPHLRLGLAHGQLRPAEKDRVMRQFRDGEIDVLVATAVVEVGVDVPNATVMLIEDADRFGLSQLHQFRGRVGRGSQQSYCYLLSKEGSVAARERLAVLERTSDGFRLAEEDLRLRRLQGGLVELG